jgi:RNA polymerase sigma-70 factor (ECF subfamily)
MKPDVNSDEVVIGEAIEADEVLMAEVVEGRHERLGLLVRRYATPLLTFIRRMVGDRHRSEELFQEVFLAVWVKRHLYESGRPFKPWLYAIALNKCRAALRSRPAGVPLSDEEAVPANGAAPLDQAMAEETARAVSGAVGCLPPQQRAVVLLRIWQNLPYARIAPIVGCSVATVRSHMHLGLAALREALAPRLGTLQLPDGMRSDAIRP